jgi:6-phosphogluconolactonase
MQIYRPILHKFTSKEALDESAKDFFLENILQVQGEFGKVRLAFPGGRTPINFYRKLDQTAAMPWGDIEVYQTDERFVDSTSPESNYKLLKDSFQESFDEWHRFIYFKTGLTLEKCLDFYFDEIDSLEAPYFDLTLLGVGEDGHVASLFPDGAYFGSKDKVIVTEAPAQYQTRERLSLTLQTILNSRKIVLMISGEDKEFIVSEMLKGEMSGTEFPVKFLMAHPELHIFFTVGE